MPVVINTNSAATLASNNLAASNAMLQKSLARLSSGKKIINPSDDAGGLAVSMKLTATINRTKAVHTNIANAQSFLQTQDGSYQTAAQVMNRISELKILSSDVTKNASDKENYNSEFTALKAQLVSISDETFNGVSLFTSAATSTALSVTTTESGSTSVDINQGALSADIATITGSVDLSSVTISQIGTAIESIATLRSENGAQSNRLSFASDMLVINQQNLESANSRIMDVDVAAESTRLAKYNILVQAGATMLVQANASAQIALKLLG